MCQEHCPASPDREAWETCADDLLLLVDKGVNPCFEALEMDCHAELFVYSCDRVACSGPIVDQSTTDWILEQAFQGIVAALELGRCRRVVNG